MQWHWRHTGEQARIGSIDASIFIPVLALLIWPAKGHWSFNVVLYASIGGVIALALLGRRGYTPGAGLLLLRTKAGEWMGRGEQPIGTTYRHLHERLHGDRTDR